MERWVLLRKGADFEAIGKIPDQPAAGMSDPEQGCDRGRSG